MTDRRTAVRPPATSWGAVIGGWVGTIGASVIFAPLVAGLVAAMGTPNSANQLALAAPVVLGILLSYIVGGYIAGRMAGYRTSWHGMMTAFFSLFILLIVLLAGGLASSGVLASSGISSLGDIIPGTRDLNVDSFGNALSFGAVLGFLAAIFGGWLGGLLAPSQAAFVAKPAPSRVPAQVMRERDRRAIEAERSRTVVPAYGRKGGERIEESERVVDRDGARVVERDERHVDDVHRPGTDH